MNRARGVLLAVLVFGFAMAAWSAPPADLRSGSGPVAVRGSYVVTFNVDLGAGAQPNVSVICKARIRPNSPALRGVEERTVPVAATEGTVAAMGRTATCSMQIPFYWAVDDLSGGVALSYQIETVNSSGAWEVRARQSTGVPSPGAGGRATLVVNVKL